MHIFEIFGRKGDDVVTRDICMKFKIRYIVNKMYHYHHYYNGVSVPRKREKST